MFKDTKLTPFGRKYVRLYALAVYGLMAAAFLGLVILTPKWYKMLKPWELLACGGVIMAAAIPFHLLGGSKKNRMGGWKKAFYVPAMLLNLLGTSMCEAAYYTHIQVRPPETDLIAGAVIPLGLCLLIGLMICLWPDRAPLLYVISGIFMVCVIIFCGIMWAVTDTEEGCVLWSFAFFNLFGGLLSVIAHFYVCSETLDDEWEDEPATAARCEPDPSAAIPAANPSADADLRSNTRGELEDMTFAWMRYLSFASFGLLLVAGVVVAFILMCACGDCDCDCDCCSGGDCGSSGNGSGTSVKRKRRR